MEKSVALFLFVLLANSVAEFSFEYFQKRDDSLRSFYLDGSTNGNGLVVGTTRRKRATSGGVDLNRPSRSEGATADPSSLVNTFNLNDTHGLLLAHWAGEGSDVIIALARDSVLTRSYSSNLYVSHDYGMTFEKQTLVLANGSESAVYWFYVSPASIGHYVFSDIIHKTIWTTSDSGRSFLRKSLPFMASFISMHPTELETLVAFESRGSNFDIHISQNYGLSWRLLHSGAKDFFWGSREHGDNLGNVYILDAIQSYAIKYNYFTSRSSLLVSNVESFQRTNEFLMAIKKVYRSQYSTNVSELWVSTNNFDFRKARLPEPNYYKEMFIADATERQIFLCASVNNTNHVNLYTSDVSGLYFSLSLENIVYYNPAGINNNTWLRSYVSSKFADMHKVEGLNGVYVATMLINASAPLSVFEDGNQVTMISFNKGGQWRYLPAPSPMAGFYCLFSPNCSLHLTQYYHSLMPTSSVQPILSSPSAPGLIIASGNIGSSIQHRRPDSFMSSNGGFSWRKILNGTYKFIMGDHGGIIAGIQKDQLTNHITYSLDEGHTWSTLEFYRNKIRVYGLSTEPGEETGVFTVFGSDPDRHSWIILQINFTKLFNKTCNDSDYTTWTPKSDPSTDCLLGQKITFMKRKPTSICYNGRNYDREVTVENCPCKIEDYECDFGFALNSSTRLCQQVQTPALPLFCFEGSFFNRTMGYRRVPMDTCEGGMEGEFEPILSNCPVRASGEFMMLANMSSIQRYNFRIRRATKIHTRGISNVVALAYDYREDCLYFADNRRDNIQVMCLRGRMWGPAQRILLTENMDQVESMAYNWVSRQLFWVDSGHKRVECLSLRNNKRMVVMKDLEEPKSIAIHPRLGYMFVSDWSASDPRIIRTTLLGTDRRIVVNRTKLPGLKWPNGISVDDQASRIFFVDAGVNKIYRCDLEGDGCVVTQLPNGSHPFSTALFKQSILWSDPMAGAVYSVSKEGGRSFSVKLVDGFPNVVGIAAFSVSAQRDSSPCLSLPCQDSNALCFETSFTTRACKCPDEFVERSGRSGDVVCACGSGTSLQGNSCVASGSASCPGDQFKCNNTKCVPRATVCDGNDDCGDLSDESCATSCASNQFQCRNGRCIPERWTCDGDNDCRDMSDEEQTMCGAPRNCSAGHFRCASGRCIPLRYVCDTDDDCLDGSDEINCTRASSTTRPPIQCPLMDFACRSGDQCVRRSYVCDSDADCMDGSDEENCTVTNCTMLHTPCRSGNQCILIWKVCDGTEDCDDGSDERECSARSPSTTTFVPWSTRSRCSSEEFRCLHGSVLQCIPLHEVCDGVPNCQDMSDELRCFNCLAPFRFRCRNGRCISGNFICNNVDDCWDNSDEMNCSAGTPAMPDCPRPSIRCTGDDVCIPESWVCDGEKDCSDGGDEARCHNVTVSCDANSFACFFSKTCINESLVCNGREDCPGGSDELNCETGHIDPPTRCNPSEFKCTLGGCIDGSRVCDGRWDCIDASDEANCSRAMLAVVPIIVLLNVSHDGVTFQISSLNSTLPTPGIFGVILTVGTRDWSYYHKNGSMKLSQSQLPINLTVNKLKPNTAYVLTVSISVNASSPPVPLLFVTPARVVPLPGPPLNVSASYARVNDSYSLVLSWSPPEGTRPGEVSTYKIEYKDTSLDADVDGTNVVQVYTSRLSHLFTGWELIVGSVYEFRVFALTTRWSKGSDWIRLEFGPKCVDVRHIPSFPGEISFSFRVDDSSPGHDAKVLLGWNVSQGLDVHSYTIKVESPVTWAGDYDGLEVAADDDDSFEGSGLGVFKTEQAMTEDCKSGKRCVILVSGLSPGLLYRFRVSAEAKDLTPHPMCRDRQLVVATPGTKLQPPIVKVSDLPDGKVNVNIGLGNDSRNELKDSEAKIKVLYRNVNSMRLSSLTFEFRVSSNRDQNFVIDHLSSCERYCFYSFFLWPMRSSLSQPDCIDISDRGDPLEAPKDVKIQGWSLDSKRTHVSATIAWSPPCIPLPMDYLIHVQLVNEDGSSRANGFFKSDTEGLPVVSFTVDNLQRGCLYRIGVRKDISGGRMSPSIDFLAEPYASPSNLTYDLIVNSNVLLLLEWERPTGDLPLNYEYEVFHSTSYFNSRDPTSFRLFDATNGLYLDVLDGLDRNVDHSFQVRLRCKNSEMKSNFSNIINVFIPASPRSQDNNNEDNGWKIWVIVIVSTVGLFVVGLLAVYVHKYRRLRSSFDSYVSTRFNSEASRAVFTQLGDNDDDQPLINRFSDDDPLIEA